MTTPDPRWTPTDHEVDLLAGVAGEVALDRDTENPRHAPFFDWLAREARLSAPAAERKDAARAAASFARSVAARLAASRAGVARADHAPRFVAAPVTRPVAGALAPAAADRRAPFLDLAIAAGAGRELWDEDCDLWVDLPPNVTPGRYVALRVAGESMTPLLHGGDVILVKLGPDVARGSIIVARRADDGYVVKQAGRSDSRSVELLSLNPDFPPARLVRREGAVVGTVVLRWCDHRAASDPPQENR